MASRKLDLAARLFHDRTASALFVSSQLRPRELKMAAGLRRLGWAVGLIYHKWTPFSASQYFDFSFDVNSADDALALAKRLSPRITHVFSGAIDDYVLKFCRDKPSPVVIDLNDVFAPSLFDYCHERFKPTREALALADGFCARDLQVKSAEHADQFRIPSHTLFFPEYAWNNKDETHGVADGLESDEVHVVSVGTFSLESQGMYDSCYLRLAELLVGQGIHFHIYPHWVYQRNHGGSPHANFERDFVDFLALAAKNPYLHIHESAPLDVLASILPQYDFGIVSGGCAEFGQKLGFYRPAYLETCYSGRISDYIDARLPVLINDEVKFDYWLLKRYGACVDLKGILRPGFKQRLLELKHKPQQREMMERAAEKLSVDYNSPRLAAFYCEIAGITWSAPIEASVGAGNRKRKVLPTMPLKREVPPFMTSLRKGYRWLAPRAAKALLPYRAIRMLEVRLHNALQEKVSNNATISMMHHDNAALESQAQELHQNIETYQARLSTLENEIVELNQRIDVLNNEKFIMQQNEGWGAGIPIDQIAGEQHWPELLNEIDRSNGLSELVRILGLFLRSPGVVDNPSACWDVLAVKNYDQLLGSGYNNFKRTIGNNYFNFLVQDGDPQLTALESLLTSEEAEACRRAARAVPEAPDFPSPDQFSYNYFVLMLWEYARKIDTQHHIETLKEPAEGNPILVPWRERLISQDLANSLIEYYAIDNDVPFKDIQTVLEIGGGYGRDAYVILALNPHVRVTLVDIPPALYIAQRYLSSVFSDRRVFKVREFSSYEDVREEMEASSIVLLMPHQLALLPEEHFDLSMNISSFGEMSEGQINWYFQQLQRVTARYFYMKQWRVSKNVFDGLELNEKAYPYPDNWQPIYSRPCSVQSEFFEALYKVSEHE